MLHNEARKLVLEAWDKTHNARGKLQKYFSVNESTVYRLIEERARTGSYETRTQLRDRKTILTEKQHHDILELVQEQPDITMKEIVETLHLPVGDEAVILPLSRQGISPARIFPITEYTTFLRKRKRGSVSYPIQEKGSPLFFLFSLVSASQKSYNRFRNIHHRTDWRTAIMEFVLKLFDDILLSLQLIGR